MDPGSPSCSVGGGDATRAACTPSTPQLGLEPQLGEGTRGGHNTKINENTHENRLI